MTTLKRAFATAAAAGLLVSQAAFAAPVDGSRSGADIEQSEAQGLWGDSAATPMLALFAVFLIAGIVLLVEDGDDDPVSP